MHARSYRYVLGARIDASDRDDAAAAVIHWARRGQSKFICAANVRLLVRAHDEERFRRVVNSADLVTCNDSLVACALRLFGMESAVEVRSDELLAGVFRAATAGGISVAILAGSGSHLPSLRRTLAESVPGLEVSYLSRLPPRRMTTKEDEELIRSINGSGARILLVGGDRCAGAEWMLNHKGRIHCVMLSSGGFLRGPGSLQRLLRLRLRRRYLETTARIRFGSLVLQQLLGM